MRLFLFGKTECYSHWRWTKEYCMIWDMFWPLSSFKIPPKGFQGSPIVPNGQPSVPREFKIKRFTLGWFHFRKTRCNLHGKWTKDYLMTWGMFWPFSGSEGSPRVPKRLNCFTIDDLVCPENMGLNILLWDDFTMGILSITRLRGQQRDIWWFEVFCLPFSGTEGCSKGPLRAPYGPSMDSMDKLVCHGRPR